MRASVIQGNLSDLRRLPDDLASEVRAAISPGVIEDVESANRIAWLPLEHDLEISDAVERVAGSVRRREWARSSMLLSMRGPLLEPMWRAALRVFGVSPGALFHVVPTGWAAVYRDVGTVKHRPSTDSAYITISDLTDVLVHNEPYLQGICGTFQALLDASRVPGSVKVESFDKRRSVVTYKASWTTKPRR